MKILPLVLFLVTLSAGTANTVSKNIYDGNRILVHVNDDIITADDLKQYIRLFLLHSGKNTSTKLAEREQKVILNEIIDQKIKLQEVHLFCKNMLKQKYFISEEEITQFIISIVNSYDLSYEEYLHTLKNAKILDTTVRSHWEAKVAWSKYLQYLYGGILNPSEEEINVLLKKHKSKKEILITMTRIFLPNSATDDDRQQLMHLSYNSSNIAEFLSNVKDKIGGKIKIMPKQEIPMSVFDKRFADFLNQFKKGDISSPINSEEGTFVICIDDRKTAQTTPLSREQARGILIEKKLDVYAMKKIKELRRIAHITYHK